MQINHVQPKTITNNNYRFCKDNKNKTINFKAFVGADRYPISKMPDSVFNYMEKMIPKITKNIDLKIIQHPEYPERWGPVPICSIKTLKDTLIKITSCVIGGDEVYNINRINSWLPIDSTTNTEVYPTIIKAGNTFTKYQFIHFDQFLYTAPCKTGTYDDFELTLNFLQKLDDFLETGGGDRYTRIMKLVNQ